ncbi:MAG: hypothetical protein ACE5H0_08255 [Bacteroidota bacterium]
MKLLVSIFVAAALSGCAPSFESARITCSTPPVVRVSLSAEDGVTEGEEFSVWRSEWTKTGEVIYRVGKIRIFRVESEGTSLAEVIEGAPELGDRVTKWLISEGGKARVLGESDSSLKGLLTVDCTE